MSHSFGFFLHVIALATAQDAGAFKATTCEGAYPMHLQGVTTNQKDSIFWSWTDSIAKTDLNGKLLKRIKADNHQGDLCFHEGKIYVAVNLGKFNDPAGRADNWIFVYDANDLALLKKHPVPEVTHGAGGIAFHQGRFIVVGGLPPGVGENYLYEYDPSFKFTKKHILKSGYTLMGIQTAAYAHGSWWFGCYGKPQVLIRTDDNFQILGKWEFDASLGIEGLPNGKLLIGQNSNTKGVGYTGRVIPANIDPAKGLKLD